MAGQRPPQEGERPRLQSVKRGRRGSWRLTAVVITAVALGAAYVGRFGLPDLEGPGASPTRRPSAAPASPTLTPPPATATGGPITPGHPTPTVVPTPRIGPTPTRRPSATHGRYRDGIPARIGDELVLTVDDALRLDRASRWIAEILVGGWYADGRLRASIGGVDPPAIKVAGAEGYLGPLIVRGAYARSGASEGVFEAREVVWMGDLQTDAAPIAAMPLLDALVRRYDDIDETGANPVELSLAEPALDCEVAWPRHTYAGQTGPVQLALIFSSPTDRLMAEPAITRTQYPDRMTPLARPGCPYPRATVTGRTRWLVDGNVMLLIRSGEPNTHQARLALADARDASNRPEQPWRPVTSWEALRALWSVYPGLDVAPPAEEVFCVPELPEDSWSLRHRFVRGIAIFASAEEREAFQATVAAADVRLERGACSGLAGQRPIDPDARWVGRANVLLLVTGPAQIDALLEAALPDPRSRVLWP